MADFVDRVILDVSDAEAGWTMLSAALQGYTVNQQSQIMAMATAQAGFENLEAKLNVVITSMDEVADNSGRAADAMEAAGGAAASSANSIGFSVNAYGLLRQAMTKVVEYTREVIGAAVDQERADLLLMNALRGAGDASYYFTESYRAQALALQEATGYRQEEIERVQALLLQLGVAPEKLDAVTQATLDLSAATGQDLFQTALMLGKAEEGIITALQRHGIVLNDTTDKTKLLDEATAKIEERFGGSASASYQGAVKDVGDLGNAFHTLSKSIGESIIELEEEQGDLAMLTNVFQFWANFISNSDEKHEQAVVDHQLEITETINLVDKHRKALAVLQIQQMDGAKDLDDQIAREEKALKQVEDHLAQLQGKTIKFAGPPVDDPKADAEADKKYEEAQDKHQAYLDKIAEQTRTANAKLEAEGDRAVAAWEKLQDERAAAELKGQEKSDDQLLAWAHRAEQIRVQTGNQFMKELEKQQREADEATQREIKKTLQAVKQLGDQLLQFAIQSFTEQLTVNSNYTAQYNALQDKRTQSDLASQGIQKTLAQVSKEREEGEKATREAALAGVLANIAEQAAIKALFTAAEATAELFYNPGAATTLFAAAGMYAAVAVAAGGAAAAITSSRGLTTEESSTLSGLQQKPNTTGAGSVADQTGGGGVTNAKQAADTIINVYQLGIAGATKAQQADELAAIQRKYDQRRMGKG